MAYSTSVNANSSSCCSRLRIVPAVITLTTSALGVALALIYTSHYVAIPFGVGGGCSLYMVYLAHEFRHLKDFETNNAMLRDTNLRLQETDASLRERVWELSAELRQFELENNRLTELLGVLDGKIAAFAKLEVDYQKNVAAFRAENLLLQATKDKLSGQLQELERINKGLAESGERHRAQLDRLAALNQSLSEMHGVSSVSFKETIRSMSEKMQKFGAENEALGKHREEMAKGSEQMVKTAVLFQGILEKVNAWQDDATHAKQIAEFEQMMKLNASMSAEHGRLQGQIEFLRAEVSKFQSLREDIQIEVVAFQQGNADLRATIDKAAAAKKGSPQQSEGDKSPMREAGQKDCAATAAPAKRGSAPCSDSKRGMGPELPLRATLAGAAAIAAGAAHGPT